MTLRPFWIVTAMACAFAVPALTSRAGGAPTDGQQEAADQVRERRPPKARETRPGDQARQRRPDDAQARDRQRPAPRPVPRPAPRVVPRPTSRGSIVFIGGYFYDPFFGPYPWWPRPLHPYWHYPPYDLRAELRVECRDRAAAVYVDAFYAGIVDDFDGNFQRLPLPPGGHHGLHCISRASRRRSSASICGRARPSPCITRCGHSRPGCRAGIRR